VRIELAVSAGELIDRLTILELKSERLSERVRSEIQADLASLRRVRDERLVPSERLTRLSAALAGINAELWVLEESLREFERSQSFGDPVIAGARRVYAANDERAALKRAIDELVGSDVREHKSHALPAV
jgi:hypothetical protein